MTTRRTEFAHEVDQLEDCGTRDRGRSRPGRETGPRVHPRSRGVAADVADGRQVGSPQRQTRLNQTSITGRGPKRRTKNTVVPAVLERTDTATVTLGRALRR